MTSGKVLALTAMLMAASMMVRGGQIFAMVEALRRMRMAVCTKVTSTEIW